MTSQQIFAYEALVNWELLGELPDQQGFSAACDELVEHQGLVKRYRKLIEECQHHENSRHSLPLSLRPLNEDSAPGENLG